MRGSPFRARRMSQSRSERQRTGVFEYVSLYSVRKSGKTSFSLPINEEADHRPQGMREGKLLVVNGKRCGNGGHTPHRSCLRQQKGKRAQ